MKKLFSILLRLLVVMSMATTAFAAGNVTYEGESQKFIFEPGSDYSPTDLFTDFKGIMPGDSITQTVTINNKASNEVKVKIYMRALGAQEDTDEFLSQMTLTVTQKTDTILFDAPADQTAQLTDWVCLGTFYSGAKVDLDVALNVPIEMGNEFQDQIGYLDWEFKVEEYPIEKGDPESPKTGDTSNIMLYTGLMAVSLVAVAILVLLAKKRRDQA